MSGRKLLFRLLAVLIAAFIVSAMATASLAQDEPADESPAETVIDPAGQFATIEAVEAVQSNLDQTWILLAGFLVFFMQAGFAMLEGGMIRQTGVVNSMIENFMDAAVTGILFFIVGYGIAFANTESSLFFGTPTLMLGGIDGTGAGDGAAFVGFFFQFAFAGAAATIATGAMAERTNFVGKLIYSAIVGAFIYPVVVFWVWGGGWLADRGFLDFAGSTVVHQTGGIIALVGAAFVGARPGRIWGNPPRPSNLAMATLGTFILWFGWYGFNVGSTLAASDVNIMGLVAVNTTLAACVGAIVAMLFMYFRTGKWDLPFALNGSLAGLVGITAGCAFVTPVAAMIIGGVAGVLVVLAVSAVEMAKIDDAVGAFAVHGVCGSWGTLAIGLFGLEALTGGSAGLFTGGGLELLGTQMFGVLAVAIWAAATSGVMFGAIKALGLLRISPEAEEVGIDVHEHGATVWPDVLPYPLDEAPASASGD
ncbi:MAG: ammonium transporter [Chloroflexi bacterium]|nr:MAG: ammonium transporter [Chloroflexota bacterium]